MVHSKHPGSPQPTSSRNHSYFWHSPSIVRPLVLSHSLNINTPPCSFPFFLPCSSLFFPFPLSGQDGGVLDVSCPDMSHVHILSSHVVICLIYTFASTSCLSSVVISFHDTELVHMTRSNIIHCRGGFNGGCSCCYWHWKLGYDYTL